MMRRGTRPPPATSDNLADRVRDLTPRQVEVLRLLSAGKTNGEIAAALGITLDGAKWHVSEILSRLGVHSREEAAAFWIEHQSAAARAKRLFAGAIAAFGLKSALGVAATAVGAAVATGSIFALYSSGSTPQDSLAATVFPTSSPAAMSEVPSPTPTSSALPQIQTPVHPMAGATPATGLPANRPLGLPRLPDGQACPASAIERVAAGFGPAAGDGPVYLVGVAGSAGRNDQISATYGLSGWAAYKTIVIAHPSYTGPLLIRGKQLDGDGEVRFAGTVYRDGVPVDRVSDHLDTEAPGEFLGAFPMTTGNGEPGWRSNVVGMYVPAPGCYGVQVDGDHWVEVIVFQSRW